MRKKANIFLIVSFIFLVQINGAIACMAYNEQSAYKFPFQAIYNQIDSFSFTFESQSISYSVHFGGKFNTYNSTHKRFTADVFVITTNDYYVSSLTATLAFDITFSASGISIVDSGSDQDTSSMFFQSDELIYEFEVYEFFAPKNLFPITLTIEFDYQLSSSEFNESGSHVATKLFDWDPLLNILIIVAIIGVSALGVTATIVFLLLRKKRKASLEY